MKMALHVVIAAIIGSPTLLAQDDVRLLDCQTTFPPELTAAALERRFGAHQIGAGDIPAGEGRFDEVTVLFPASPEDRIEIVWRDKEARRSPGQMWVRGERSRWHTRTGLTVGTDLRSVEKLNRRPFRLAGFGWDYSGTVVSWQGGRLEAPKSSGCRLRAVFDGGGQDSAISRQVLGDRLFSSAHPAMQALNPRIERLWLEY